MSLLSAILAKNPVLCWDLSPTSGSTVTDLTASPANGTLHGVFTLAQYGPDGQKNAIAFDGGGGTYLDSAANVSKINALTGSMSVEFFVNFTSFPAAGSSAALVGRNQTGGLQSFYVRFDTVANTGFADGLTRYLYGIGLYTQLPATAGYGYNPFRMKTNQWYHIVGVYDDTLKAYLIYLDGECVSYNPVLAGYNPPATTVPLNAAGVGGDRLTGKLGAAIALYGYALTAAQIRDNYAYLIPSNVSYHTKARKLVANLPAMAFLHYTLGTYMTSSATNLYSLPSINNFAPTNGGPNINQWLDNLQANGFNDVFLTSKHGPSFPLWPTATAGSVYSLGATTWYSNTARDIIKEYTTGCHLRRMGCGLYFHVYDNWWIANNTYPGGANYLNYVKAQLTELLTWYGAIDYLFLDGFTGAGTVGSPAYVNLPLQDVLTHIQNTQPNTLVLRNVGNAGTTGISVNFATDMPTWEEAFGLPSLPYQSSYLVLCTDASNYWVKYTDVAGGWVLRTAANLLGVLDAMRAVNCVPCFNFAPGTDGLISSDQIALMQQMGTALRGALPRNTIAGTRSLGVPGTLNASNLNTALGNGQPDLTAADLSLGRVVGDVTGNNSEMADIAAIKIAVAAIPTNPLLTNDVRLANLDAAVSSRATAAAVAAIPTNPLLTTDARLGNLDTAISSRASATAVAAIPTNPLLTTDARLGNLDAAISSRATTTAVAAIPTNPLLTTDTRLANLDATISSRLGGSAYTAPDNADIAAIKAAVIGPGAKTVELVIKDSLGNPVADVDVWITTDSAGNDIIAGTVKTDSFGTATLYLDAGTYYRWAQKTNENFVNPQTFTVT